MPDWQRSHYNLDAWKEAMTLARFTYSLTKNFPRDEQYGLTSQVRRSAVSIPSNIAEGAARGTKKEFAQFVIIARGSLSELETQFLLAADFGYLEKDHEVFVKMDTVSKLLSGLKTYLQA